MQEVVPVLLLYFKSLFGDQDPRLTIWLEQALPNQLLLFCFGIVVSWTVMVLAIFSMLHAIARVKQKNFDIPHWLKKSLQLFVVMTGALGILFLLLDGFSGQDREGTSYSDREFAALIDRLRNQERGTNCLPRLRQIELSQAELAEARILCSWDSTSRLIAEELEAISLVGLDIGLRRLEEPEAKKELERRVASLKSRFETSIRELTEIDSQFATSKLPTSIQAAMLEIKQQSQEVLKSMDSIPRSYEEIAQLRSIDSYSLVYVTVLSAAVAVEISLLLGPVGGMVIAILIASLLFVFGVCRRILGLLVQCVVNLVPSSDKDERKREPDASSLQVEQPGETEPRQ